MDLLKRLGGVETDNLVVGTDPALRIGSGILRKGEQRLRRGTVLAKSSKDSLLVILGTAADGDEVLEPYAILTDDTTVTDEENVHVPIYIGGKFNSSRISVLSGYTMTEADKDVLRKYNIEFTAADTV